MFYKIPSCHVIHFYYVNSTAEVRNDFRSKKRARAIGCMNMYLETAVDFT